MLNRVDARNVCTLVLVCSLLWLFVIAECDCPRLPARCEAEEFKTGSIGYVICDFADDIFKQPVAELSVSFNSQSWNESTPESNPVLLCHYGRNYSCNIEKGYSFNYKFSSNITLQIDYVTEKNNGHYFCSAKELGKFDQRRWKVIPCKFVVKDIGFTTPGSQSFDDSSSKTFLGPSSTNCQTKQDISCKTLKDIVVSCVVTALVTIIVVLGICQCCLTRIFGRCSWWTLRPTRNINNDALQQSRRLNVRPN